MVKPACFGSTINLFALNQLMIIRILFLISREHLDVLNLMHHLNCQMSRGLDVFYGKQFSNSYR